MTHWNGLLKLFSSAEITEIALKFDKSHFLAYVGLDKFQCQGTPGRVSEKYIEVVKNPYKIHHSSPNVFKHLLWWNEIHFQPPSRPLVARFFSQKLKFAQVVTL